jgi:hypothetical protein
VTAAIQSGVYRVAPTLTVYTNGLPLNYSLPISTGSVTVDRSSANRRRAHITSEIIPSVPPPVILPTLSTSPLAPFGNEVVLQEGITNQAGVTSYVTLGTFAIATSTVVDQGTEFVVTLDCYDRSWVISQRKFKTPYNIPAAGGNFATELQTLLNTVWASTLPALTYNITSTTLTVPSASYNEGQDPWQAALDMATAIGYELFFDVNGVVTAFPIPIPSSSAPSWTYSNGSANSPKVITDTFTRDGIYNDFIISGTGTQNATGSSSGSTTPVRAEQSDTNPYSPTYVNGQFGDVPSFGYSNLITTASQASSAATYALNASLSAAQQISLDVLPNPLFDIDDVVEIFWPRLSMNDAEMVIDTIQHTIRHDDATKLTGRVIA